MAASNLNSKANNKILRKFGITNCIEIRLTKLSVVTSALLDYKQKEKHLKCTYCSFTTKYSQNLTIHIRQHTGEKPYKCHRCKFAASDNANLKRHLQLHTGNKPFACAQCNYKCFRKHSLDLHVKTHTGEKLYKCDFCDKRMTTNSHKNSHMRICKKNPKQKDATWVAKQRKFNCNSCDFSTAQALSLKSHVMIHTCEKPVQCSLCTKRFKRQGELHTHIFSHTGEKPYKCNFCDTRFTQSSHKNSHEKRCKFNPSLKDKEWVEQQKKFKCHLCKYASIESTGLRRHLRTHTGEKPYSCKLCTFICSTSSALNSHLRTHTKEKPFKCPHCFFSTARNTDLNLHILRIHSKQILPRKFPCQFCLKKFYNSSSLQNHHLTHTGEKPHVCQYCQKRCTQLCHKKIHERFCKLNPANKNFKAQKIKLNQTK